MAYQIALTDEARHDLARLPEAARAYVVQQLQVLAGSPTTLSKPSRFPYPAKCQLYPFEYRGEGEAWELCVMFQYAQDEQALQVLRIGRSRLGA